MMHYLYQNRKQQGSVMVMTASILFVLIALGALLLGISYRANQIQRATSALREATRTASQQWDYSGFAKDAPTLNNRVALERARVILDANITSIPGRVATQPVQAQWSIVTSGTCGSIPIGRPSVCGSMTVFVSSLPLGLPGGDTALTVQAVSTIDTGTKK